MNIIRHAAIGQTVTLFDHSIHQKFNGSLLFDVQSKPSRSLNLTKVLSGLLLVISIFGFIGLALPVALSAMSFHQTPLEAKTPVEQPIDTAFTITIPKIAIETRIIPNVDTTNEKKYMDALKLGVAQASDSYLPGQGGPVVLFAHSTDTLTNILQYNAQFYAVKNLTTGDHINIYYQGKNYHYQITEQKIIDPKDLNSIRQSKAQLILITCSPPGTDWQRLVTFANLSP